MRWCKYCGQVITQPHKLRGDEMWKGEFWTCYKSPDHLSHKPTEETMTSSEKVHSIEDLVAGVRAIPPSHDGVIDKFLSACVKVSKKGGVLDEDKVIQIVDSWPDACPEGRDRYLKEMGIERPVVELIFYPRLAVSVQDDKATTYKHLSTTTPNQNPHLASVFTKPEQKGKHVELGNDLALGVFDNASIKTDALRKILDTSAADFIEFIPGWMKLKTKAFWRTGLPYCIWFPTDVV